MESLFPLGDYFVIADDDVIVLRPFVSLISSLVTVLLQVGQFNSCFTRLCKHRAIG
jgi:hypothetical protein